MPFPCEGNGILHRAPNSANPIGFKMKKITNEIIDLWSDINPAAGYTGGHLPQLTTLFFQTAENMDEMRGRIQVLRSALEKEKTSDLKDTGEAILTSLFTQLQMSRASGAGPSGTGMGGIWAAADGVFYIVLKGDGNSAFVQDYLTAVLKTVTLETQRWQGQDFNILLRKECLNTADYLTGTLKSLVAVNKKCGDLATKINQALADYRALFAVAGLESDDFSVYWPIFQKWDTIYGQERTFGYPESLQNYYQLPQTDTEIEIMANAWLESDLPVTTHIAERISQFPFVKGKSLQEIWDSVSKEYTVDFGKYMTKIVAACENFGAKYVIAHGPDDHVKFDATPEYLVNLVTGGEDFAVNYLKPKEAYSQLYLTKSKNTSLLTMINILVHEASHGYNFVLSAKNGKSELLNLNTSLEVPMTEGMAYYREFQFWAAAQNLLGEAKLNQTQKDYLELYTMTSAGKAPAEQGVLCAQLETYIWRIIRYIRALCDVKVNGGKMTYTDFIAWAAKTTGLSEETLHGECFTFLALPGYAPCYAVGGATYAMLQKQALCNNISEIDFNTFASKMGFYSWPQDIETLKSFIK